MKIEKRHTTHYVNTFIEVAADSHALSGEVPPLKSGIPTIARLQYEMIKKHPYQYTSDEILFHIFVKRNHVPKTEMKKVKETYFSKGQACLRTSSLGKRYGWGFHFNEEGKVAIYGRETESYENFSKDPSIQKIKAMKNGK